MIQASAHGEPINVPCVFCIHIKKCWGQLAVLMLILEPSGQVSGLGGWNLGSIRIRLSVFEHFTVKKIYGVFKLLFSFPPSFF